MAWREDYEDGLEFQDYVMEFMADKLDTPIQFYCSKAYRQKVGESRQGYEVKHDRKMLESGGAFIETHQKSQGTDTWVPSGISLENNAKWWIIGDYLLFFVVRKDKLRRICTSQPFPKKFHGIEGGNQTKGIKLPIRRLRLIAEHIVDAAEIEKLDGVFWH